jgi:hypothetical protein
MVLLFFLDGLTSFEIKNQIIKTSVYCNLLFGNIIISMLILLFIKSKLMKTIHLILPMAMTIFIYFVIGPMRIMFSDGVWRTQIIIYKHKHLKNRTIEYQMQDVGSLGYHKRTVEVIYLTKLFMIIKDMPNDIDEKIEWERIDKEINEMGIKYP